ncbi:MAG: HEAT repeat domain-containing protein, partial [Pirellulales bacterium]|nr:HEAT repeat domain-containing protein [Pirellulales bacterium]
IIHVNEELAQDLDELKVPSNISLRGRAYRIEDAIAQMNAQDRSLRGRAIEILGEAGDSSAIVTEALHQAAADGDEYIQNAAQRALKQIEQAEDPLIKKLGEQVDAFLDNHPQRLRIPSPQELLDRLREIDDQYAKGFTAKGTLVQPTLSDPDHLIAWTVTMGNDRIIIQKQAVEDTDHPPAAGRLEDTIYIGPDQMAMIHRERIWVDGKLIDTKPHATLEPVGSTYDLLMGRIVWPIGRCFSRRIDRITQVTADAGGMLKVTAESDEGNLKMRWEMRIDPSADCLVRSAKAFCHGQSDPSYIVDNAGLFGSANRCIAHTARWAEGVYARPISISVTSVSDKRDDALIQRTEDWLKNRPDQE